MNQTTIDKIRKVKELTAKIQELEAELASIFEAEKKPRVNKLYQKPVHEIVFDAMKGIGGSATHHDIRKSIIDSGIDIPQGTVSSAINRLKKSGLVESDAGYRWKVKA